MGMTIDEYAKMLIAKIECMKRETSGTDTDCNLHNCDDCSLCYEQGTMGEQKETLLFAVETMRKYQKIRDKISTIYVGYRHGYEVMADVIEILREVEDGNVD